MNDGVIFNTDAPMMEGHWYNYQTEDNFTVKDSFFEDGQYVVITTDGRMLNYNQIQHYVKVDKPIVKHQEPKIPKVVMDLIEGSDGGLMLEDEMGLVTGGGLGNIYNKPVQPAVSDDYIIDKALSKTKLPDITVNIQWKDFPKQEIDMLVKLMDLSVEDIIKYYLSKVDVASIRECVARSVKQYIMDSYGVEPELTVSEPTHKPSKTKSKKK